ncbi:MAG: efflux RND transporter periplasmic adaptor subunit, partial [Candidatus Obscuribacterales bacterium]|nr:efflux RND transporter periplasmic adaptor subunit [Candidatus Obscuribacterales bacterium]
MGQGDSRVPITSGSKFDFSAIVKWLKENFLGLATIGIITVVCVIIVQVFKKPGQMSVIESQAMDMSIMVPPKGAVPVGIAKVERQEIEGSVTYTGTVQAFEDEDIYPRITGRIVSMPVYPGDRVQKGQVLVQLDPLESEYKAKQEETLFAEDAAEHNAGIAKSEFSQKKYELEAAEQAEEAAKKAIEESEANFKYWAAEVDREKKLYEAQVISIDEYQKELSFCEAARARRQQDEAKLRQAAKTRMAAQAALDTMIHHIGHQFAAAKQAKAVAENATIYRKYTRIVAHDDGVVTKRLISPSVTVNPGMMILKVAHVKQVRIQAEVASGDAGKILVGNKVYIKGSEGSYEELEARVTAVFPAADPSSRTSTVEALINNLLPKNQSVEQYRFLPGQYVIMRITTGTSRGLVIPTSAVVWREGKAQAWKAAGSGEFESKKRYQCLMHPEVISDKPGTCPKCGMALQPVTNGEKSLAGKGEYTCSMHPEVISDKPGKCPKCGMDLVLKELGEQAKTQYTCTMHPEVISDKAGKCPKCGMDLVPKQVGGRLVAGLVDISTGISNPDKTEVVSGLNEGDEVIFAGYANLQPGMPVVGVKWGAAGPKELPLASEVVGNRLDVSTNWTHSQMYGDLMIDVKLSPAKSSFNSIVVKVAKHGGDGVSGARVNIKTLMPGMNMTGPELRNTTD